MKVLVINAGSSSLKYQLFEMNDEKVLARGNCERIGAPDGEITHHAGDVEIKETLVFPSHKDALLKVIDLLANSECKVVDGKDEIAAIGHRVAHGGRYFKGSVLVTDEVLARIDELAELSPLHNPPQAQAIRACQEVFGKDKPMVATFDTAFHQTMPKKAFFYPVPYEYYEKYGVRRYGFHGSSHRYISRRYYELIGKQDDPTGTKLIVCHLGNGSSLSAIVDGKSVDTTMGMTPLEGPIMGTRSGGIDSSVVTFISNREHLSADQMDELLNKRSGFLGISGVSSDMRDLRAAAAAGNERAQLPIDLLVYQLKKLIGGYIAAMNGCTAVIFTGGIGENDDELRRDVCSDMEALGIRIDLERNKEASRKEAIFSAPDSITRLMVIPTNEEIIIARDTKELVAELAK